MARRSEKPRTVVRLHPFPPVAAGKSLKPALAVDDRARTLGYSETIRARNTRCIRATVKQYARLAWVYLWSLERVIDLEPPANVD